MVAVCVWEIFAVAQVPGPRFLAVLGLVSNHGELETRDYLLRRLDEAAKFVPVERAALCPRFGFSNSTEDVVWRKLALIQEVASEVWRPGDHG